MNTIIWGAILFGFAILVHVAAWKIRVPRRQAKTLMQILFFCSFAPLAAMPVLGRATLFGLSLPCGPAEYFHIALFLAALILGYSITYSALEVDSPSLVITLKIAEAGPDGLPEARLREIADDSLLVIPRIDDLVKDKMACIDGGRYRLTPKGRMMAEGFTIFRELIRAGKGG